MKKSKSGWLKIKMGFILIVLLLIALVGHQNKLFFLNTYSFTVDFYFFDKTFPDVPNAAFLAGFFFAGLLLTFILTLSGKFKSKKTIKALNSQVKRLQEENNRLEEEVGSLKAGPPEQADNNHGDDDGVD